MKEVITQIEKIVNKKYNATYQISNIFVIFCGLVMKDDIAQQHCVDFRTLIGCGLVMKENVPCCQQTAQKKYPWILGNVSLDKRASIQGYLAK